MHDYSFFPTLSPSSTGLHGLDFSGPGPSPAPKNDNFEAGTKHKILTQTLPDQFFSDFGPERLDLSDFKADLFNYLHITFFLWWCFWSDTLENLFLFCQPCLAHWEKSPLICRPCLTCLKKHLLFADWNPCRSLSSRLCGETEQTEKVHSKQ